MFDGFLKWEVLVAVGLFASIWGLVITFTPTQPRWMQFLETAGIVGLLFFLYNLSIRNSDGDIAPDVVSVSGSEQVGNTTQESGPIRVNVGEDSEGATSNATDASTMDRNVLVLADDFDQRAAPSDSRLSKEVVSRIQTAFEAAGYGHVGASTLSAQSDDISQGRKSRAVFCSVAMGLDKSPDILVLLSTYAVVDRLDYVTRADLRIVAEVVDCSSRQEIGSYNVESPQSFELPMICSKKCQTDQLIREAGPLARDLGGNLTDTLGRRLATNRKN